MQNTILVFLEEENFKLVKNPEQKTYFAHNGSSTIDLGTFSLSTNPIRKHIPILTDLTIRTHKKRISENHKSSISRKQYNRSKERNKE
ncbi:hypothetical protein C0J52_27182 [Blattella germanica]|nr:hypothetical protein C0J52_27182 [Blattella germanica]